MCSANFHLAFWYVGRVGFENIELLMSPNFPWINWSRWNGGCFYIKRIERFYYFILGKCLIVFCWTQRDPDPNQLTIRVVIRVWIQLRLWITFLQVYVRTSDPSDLRIRLINNSFKTTTWNLSFQIFINRQFWNISKKFVLTKNNPISTISTKRLYKDTHTRQKYKYKINKKRRGIQEACHPNLYELDPFQIPLFVRRNCKVLASNYNSFSSSVVDLLCNIDSFSSPSLSITVFEYLSLSFGTWERDNSDKGENKRKEMKQRKDREV